MNRNRSLTIVIAVVWLALLGGFASVRTGQSTP